MLTQENYYEPNGYISNSKAKLFLQDRERFYQRHVLGKNNESAKSPQMMIGSMVDKAVELGNVECIEQLFTCDKKDTSKEKVTKTPMETAKAIAGQLIASQWYLDRKGKYQMQVILESEVGGMPICGKPDMIELDVPNNTVYIDDLKISNEYDCSTDLMWHNKCLELGYYMAAGNYGTIMMKKFPPTVKFVYRHIVVDSKIKEGKYNVYYRTLDFDEVRLGAEKFINTVCDIKKWLSERVLLPDELPEVPQECSFTSMTIRNVPDLELVKVIPGKIDIAIVVDNTKIPLQ